MLKRFLYVSVLIMLMSAPPFIAFGENGSNLNINDNTNINYNQNTNNPNINNSAVLNQLQQTQGQAQNQTNVGIVAPSISNVNNSPSVTFVNGTPQVSVSNAANKAAKTTEDANAAVQAAGTTAAVKVENNSPSLALANNSPALVVVNPDIPTQYPDFAMNPPNDLPLMRHHDVHRAWNTAPSLFDMNMEWEYASIGGYHKKVVVDGKEFGKGKGKYDKIKIYISKEDAMKSAGVKPLSNGKGEQTVRYLFAGATHADVEGVSILDCEMAALAKARELGANGIIVKVEGFTVASKTSGWNFGAGASGTVLERFGSLALGIPINFAFASALGDGYAKPFVCFYIVETF